MSGPGSAAQTVRDTIEANRYLVLATADAAGRPWSSPVYFAHIGLTDFFWVSSSEATHSRNIAVRPEVGIAIFDSQVPIGAGQGVYMSADAHWILAKDGQPDHRVPVSLREETLAMRGAHAIENLPADAPPWGAG